MYGKDRKGTARPVLIDPEGKLVSISGDLTEVCEQGRLFGVCNQAAVATTAALATTWTGLCISNPTGSNKNMIIHEFGFSQTVAASADGAVGLLSCTIAAPATNVTIQNQKFGGAGSVMIADDGATIVTPVLQRVFGAIGTLAVTGYATGPLFAYKVGGGIIVPPGQTIATYTTKATTASLIFYFVFEEKAL